MTTRFAEITRRGALQTMGVLVVAAHLPLKAFGQTADAPFAPNAFVRIAEDDTVTVIVRNFEMGQGPYTGFATLVAEELDADWAQMRAEGAPPGAPAYINPGFGMHATGGSTSITTSYDEMRRAGAAARTMLVDAAADAWGVPASEITVQNGVIRHAASGREGRFGEFVAAAARRPAPELASVTLKDPSQFRLIGVDKSVRRIDAHDKITGKPVFTIDIDAPDALNVVLARPERFGGKAASVDDAAARAIPGVVDVKTLPTGVAVYARGTWPALRGAQALTVQWDDSAAEARGSEELWADFRELSQTPGIVAGEHGDIDAALADADQVIEATYEFPYLSHSPMEPVNAYIDWDGQRVRARYASQAPGMDQLAIAGVLGIPPTDVSIEVIAAGGSFGRRGQFVNTLAEELANAALAHGPGAKLKLQWTREDDVRGGFYRPMMLHRFRGGIKDGAISAWHNTVVGQSLVKGTPFQAMLTSAAGVDQMAVEGVSELPYAIPNFRCDAHHPDIGVPVLFWRSVGHSHTAYAKESFLDELLAAIGADPVQGRLDLLAPDSKEAGVLRAAAELANWQGARVSDTRARGVAVVSSFSTSVAQIAEVAQTSRGLEVKKVWCAVDCGQTVNPDIVRAQMEGGIGFALGHAMYAQITMDAGRVQQGNFDTYRSLRMHEMPDVEVVIVPSTAHPTGVGEPGVPPAGPAVANAIAAMGRARPRTLPMVGLGTA